MAKYNRLCVSISESNTNKLDSMITNTNKNINILTKSNMVDLALTKMFENATSETIATEIQKQIVVD